MKKVEICALVTARGGSKTVPGKNIKPMAGKPMIAWTIQAALGASCVGRVVVSSDDPRIMETAVQWGAQTPFQRPAELAGDDSPHTAVVRHALDWLAQHQGYRPDYLLLLQPTSPLRLSEDIDQAARLAEESGAPAVISVCPAPAHPWLLKRMDAQGRLSAFAPVPEGYLRRQDFPPIYAINGAIYLVRREVIEGQGTLHPQGAVGMVMPEERSMDVDTPFDFQLCELILEARNGNGTH